MPKQPQHIRLRSLISSFCLFLRSKRIRRLRGLGKEINICVLCVDEQSEHETRADRRSCIYREHRQSSTRKTLLISHHKWKLLKTLTSKDFHCIPDNYSSFWRTVYDTSITILSWLLSWIHDWGTASLKVFRTPVEPYSKINKHQITKNSGKFKLVIFQSVSYKEAYY
jgi:hypothetical protein